MRSVGVRFLLPFGLLAVLFSIFVLYRTYLASQRHANQLVSQQAALALEFNLAIREYAAEKIRPAMEAMMSKDQFIPETMSTSFITRSVFEKVRSKFTNCFIHFASDNPRNPINQASPDELRLIEYFRRHPEVNRRTDFVQINGRDYLAHFAPMRVKPECLHCHGDPKDAPAALVARYGVTASFQRVVGDIAALDTVGIPVDTINAALASEMRWQLTILAAGLALLFGSVMIIFRMIVSRRLSLMAKHFHGIASHPESPWLKPLRIGGRDEIGVVAAAFNRLVEQLHSAQALLEMRVSQRTSELAQTNEQLRREIADRQQAEQALKESEERYTALIERSRDGVYLHDFEGRFLDANPAALEMLGYAKEDLAWVRFQDVLAGPDQLAQAYAEVEKLIETGRQTEPTEYRLKRKDGQLVWAETQACLVYRQNKPIAIQGIARDVTERKLAEEKLKESKEYLHQILNCVGDPIFVKDEHHRYLLVNTAECMLAGKASDQLLGKSDFDLFPKEQAEEFWRRDAAVLATGLEDINEELVTDAQGRIRTVITKKTLFTDRTGKKHIVGVIRDITDYKLARERQAKLENQLRQSQKMEAIGTLAGGIAHDFNNILSIIIPNTEVARGEAGENGLVTDCLAEVLSAAERAKDLVKQILAFSRQSQPELKPIQLQLVVKEVVKMLRSTIPSTIEMYSAVEEGVPPILADPVQIHQVLMNLCTNAAQAMRNGPGQIEVKLEALTLEEDFTQLHPEMQPGTYAKLSVSDTGTGMDTETLKRIFEPFFTTKAPGQGTGLGLAVVHGIVKGHGGHIYAYSQPNAGTVFHIYFPACDSRPLPLERASAELPKGNGERILFVDDEKHLTQIADRCLRRLGYLVTTSESPLEALQEFQRHPGHYDLVFTDLTMPKMTGIDFAQAILKIRADVPVILATGFSGLWTQEEVRTLGIKELVLKPFTPAVLAETLHKVLKDRS